MLGVFALMQLRHKYLMVTQQKVRNSLTLQYLLLLFRIRILPTLSSQRS